MSSGARLCGLFADQLFRGQPLISWRAMITRMISLVPSRIWWTRRSRKYR
jgi:hypothetical protein